MDQNHLGKFLKLNSIEFPLIEYQLFNFSKESLKQIFLNSKCGEIINGKEFKDKPPNTDLIGTKNIYPLACVYKKGKPKIKPEKQIYSWKKDKIKKKIDILSNAYMTLSILNLAEYYDRIIESEKKRKKVVKFYLSSAKCQLNYYVNNFRSELGVFINKKYIEDGENKKDNINFESSSSSFNFPPQTYLMTCFYKCSELMKDTSPYKIPFLNFSYEMEKMFLDFKDKILKDTPKNLIELLYAFSVYIKSKDQINKEVIYLCFDIIEHFVNHHSLSSISTYDKILLYNSMRSFKPLCTEYNGEFYSYKEIFSEYLWDLEEIFDDPNFYNNEILNEYDLISYQIYLLMYNKEKSHNFYNKILLPSKVFSCFPNIPKKYESEKYFKFNHKDEYKIPDKYFKPLNYKTMDSINITPIICKDIHYIHDKNKFSKPKVKFDSLINMRLTHLIIYSLKEIIIKSINK